LVSADGKNDRLPAFLSHYGAASRRFALARVTLRRGESSGAEPQYERNWSLEEAKKIAWKAQQRLHKRYRALEVRGKNKNQIVTAVGRELLGFIWAIAVETEKKQMAKAA
jgi:hypothetical protein